MCLVIIMALLRSDIINKDLIEQVLKKHEGTNRVVLVSLTVGPCGSRAALLEERLRVQVNAYIRGRSKDYDWTAKVLRSESGPANYARFQGLLETEVNFYSKLLPELAALGSPLPQTLPFLWGSYQTLNREILLVQRENSFKDVKDPVHGLDLAHVLLAVEWLAKLHGLSYVAKKRFEKENPDKDWLAVNPWIRKELEDSSSNLPLPSEGEMKADVHGGVGQALKARLVAMAKKALQMEKSSTSTNQKLDELMERQDWLDEMRRQTHASSDFESFWSLCHGQPWLGNVQFAYNDNGEPIEAIFNDFQSVAYGRTGQDVAHFLLASTTREFRQNHLETVLQAYMTELEDVLNHQGEFDGPPYSLSSLRHDYKRGIYTGITFCLFAMPKLSNKADMDNNGQQQTDAVDGAGGLELSSSVGFSMQRASDALLEHFQN